MPNRNNRQSGGRNQVIDSTHCARWSPTYVAAVSYASKHRTTERVLTNIPQQEAIVSLFEPVQRVEVASSRLKNITFGLDGHPGRPGHANGSMRGQRQRLERL